MTGIIHSSEGNHWVTDQMGFEHDIIDLKTYDEGEVVQFHLAMIPDTENGPEFDLGPFAILH